MPENSCEITAKLADFSANLSLKIPQNLTFSSTTYQKPCYYYYYCYYYLLLLLLFFSLPPLFLGWVCKVHANRQKSKPVKQRTFTIRYSDILKFKHLCCHGAWATTKQQNNECFICSAVCFLYFDCEISYGLCHWMWTG